MEESDLEILSNKKERQEFEGFYDFYRIDMLSAFLGVIWKLLVVKQLFAICFETERMSIGK